MLDLSGRRFIRKFQRRDEVEEAGEAVEMMLLMVMVMRKVSLMEGAPTHLYTRCEVCLRHVNSIFKSAKGELGHHDKVVG